MLSIYMSTNPSVPCACAITEMLIRQTQSMNGTFNSLLVMLYLSNRKQFEK